MTVKELQQAIREQTMEINQRLIEYHEQGIVDPLVNKEISYLKELIGQSQKSPYLAMNTHKKNKTELQLQLNELRYFEAWDIFTPQGRTQRGQREIKAWRSYKQNYGNISFESWRRFGNIMGSAGADVINQFGGSNDTLTTVNEAVKAGKSGKQILEAMDEVVRQNKGSGKSTEDYIDDLRLILGLNDV